MKTINLFGLLLLTLYQIQMNAQTVNYTPSAKIIANPERGLQKYSITGSDYATKNGANNLSVTTLNTWKNSADKVTIVFRYFQLDAFMNSDINATYINNMQADFDNVRSAGFKTIIRFAYSNTEGTGAQQPGKEQILKHISQLAPLLNANKDVIISLQAGFIGTWGEWYYTNSSEFGTDGQISSVQWNNRKEILDAMLASAPAEIPVQVRYVGVKERLYGNTPLTEEKAYQNTANARIGFYNDAFLNNYGDMGTFTTYECENPVGTSDYNYLANETKYLPMTGETNGLNNCQSGLRTAGENAIYEMDLTNWSSINRDYHQDFWNQLNSDQYSDILKNLGYRFVLNSSTVYPNTSGFELSLNISNVGFARPFKQRDVFLILKNLETNAITSHLVDTDIRTWESSVLITQKFDIAYNGTFQLYLWMPDKETSLTENCDYSIQLANKDLWDTETGFNDLKQTFTIDNLLAVEEFSTENYFQVYPNPATDFITIHLNDFTDKEVQIINSMGQVVRETAIVKNEKIDISDLNAGIYFICLSSNPVGVLKFIKK